MLKALIRIEMRQFADLISRNERFLKKVQGYKKSFDLHEQARSIDKKKEKKYIEESSNAKIAAELYQQSKFDQDTKAFIKKFNKKHQGSINMLDFSNYTSEFGDLKDIPLKKQDMEMIQEFQKRKIDMRMRILKQIPPHQMPTEMLGMYESAETNIAKSGLFTRKFLGPSERMELEFEDQQEMEGTNAEVDQPKMIYSFPEKEIAVSIDSSDKEDRAGLFEINSEFVMLLLNKSTTTKITTLNRINFYRVLLFMGNGAGIVSHGKSRALKSEDSMNLAVLQCKKNLIAIPLDPRCTLPRGIERRFQDYHLYLRPLASFNSWGHPVMATLLSLTGFGHLGFKTVHTGKNMYTLLGSYFKAVTKNTTPQEMAEQEGYKVYRHRFVRPLTRETTHVPLSH